VEAAARKLHPRADDLPREATYLSGMFRILADWWRGRGMMEGPGERATVEVKFLRILGFIYLALFVFATASTEPHPSYHGSGLAVALGFVGFIVGLVVTNPRAELSEDRRLTGLLLVLVSSAILAAFQPKGLWQASPYFIGVVAAMRLERRRAVAVMAVTLAVLATIGAIRGEWGSSVSVLVAVVPWFLLIRVMRRLREQNEELMRSRAAEARSAAAAERGRVAREMHDVLAHSLSALALQLETTRLLAGRRDTDPEVTRAIDRAHHLAAGGLEEARRAIGALRGDELPGPERLDALAHTFEEQSGVVATVEVRGDPRPLEPEARLALYRTAQEAFTNVLRHAAPERVELLLDYRNEATVLTVRDHGALPAAVPAGSPGGGYGLTGMRERAELLGGRLAAEPTRDGFRVELWLPA
jgi:signal transduction histidine kinase